MGGHGSFEDERIEVAVAQTPDLVAPKLAALLAYQETLHAPGPAPHIVDRTAAARGKKLFRDAARCSTCHVPPQFTDVLSGPDESVPVLHDAAETGMDPAYALRSATGRTAPGGPRALYRTTPLRGLLQHPPYFHDGSAASLLAVVDRYDRTLELHLSAQQKADLVEYLKTL
jgi:cytochrome c peroxidase